MEKTLVVEEELKWFRKRKSDVLDKDTTEVFIFPIHKDIRSPKIKVVEQLLTENGFSIVMSSSSFHVWRVDLVYKKAYREIWQRTEGKKLAYPSEIVEFCKKHKTNLQGKKFGL